MRAGVAALAVMLAAGAARADEIVLTYVGFHITVLRKEHSDAGRKACDAALGSFALAVDDADLSPLKAPDAGRAAALAPAPTPTPPNRAGAPTAGGAGVGASRPWWAGLGVILVVVLLPVIGFFGYRLLKELRK